MRRTSPVTDIMNDDSREVITAINHVGGIDVGREGGGARYAKVRRTTAQSVREGKWKEGSRKKKPMNNRRGAGVREFSTTR